MSTEDVIVRLRVDARDFQAGMTRLQETMAFAGAAFARMGERLGLFADVAYEPDNGPSPDWYGWQMIADRLAE